MTATTPTDPVLCACGAPVDADHIALHRSFPSLIPLHQCRACSDAEEADEQRRKQAIARVAEQSEREARLLSIPPEMLRSRINHPQWNAGLWVRVESWTPSRLKWLGIVGGAGECKTRCMALLAQRLILAGHRLTWTTMVEFQDQVDASLRGDRAEAKDAHRYFAACKSTGILVVDDFGKNTWNPTLERHLFGIIDHRKTHDLPVLWTANTSPLEILATAGLSRDRGAPLIGRLLEASIIESA